MAGSPSPKADRVNVAVVLTGIDPPRDMGRMVVVVRRLADLLVDTDNVVRGSISTKTSAPLDRLPEHAEAARTALASTRHFRPFRRTIRVDPLDATDLDLFVHWAPWSDDARLRTRRRRDVRLSVRSSGRALWANLDRTTVDEVDGWLRSRALGHLVDIDEWARDQRQQHKQMR